MNNMKNYFNAILLCFVIGNVQGQNDCGYVPLQLDDVTPKWDHLVIDTTIIGYVDTTAFWSDGDHFYNGMNHVMGFPNGTTSLVTDDHLYSYTNVKFDIDLGGFIMEKIDLETGELLWKNVIDPRTEDFEYKVLESEVIGNELHVYGVRTIMDDNAIYGFVIGYEDSHQFHRVYDDDTGELVREETPITLDENAAVVNSFNGSDYNYFKDDYWESFNLTVWLDSGSVLTRQLIDTFGYAIGAPKRVVVGDWNEDWDNSLITGAVTTLDKLLEGPNETYAYVQQYITAEEDPRESNANVTLFDKDFNVINKLELLPYLNEGFEGVSIVSYTEQGLLLWINYEVGYYHDFLFLDNNLNFIKYTKTTFNDNYVFIRGHKLHHLSDDNQLHLYSPGRIDSTSLSLNFYKFNNNDNLDYIRRFDIENEGWGAFATDFIILNNGDYLLKMTSGCFEDGQFGPNYISWMRIDKSEFDYMVHTDDVTVENDQFVLSPNPATDYLSINSNSTKIETILIYDMMGQVINVDYDKLGIDISNLLPGSYVVSILDSNGTKEQHMLVKCRGF